jgi:hypothetical protein
MDSNLHDAGPVRSVTSRPYEAEADLQQIHALLMEGRSQTNDWRYWHVGELAFGFFMIDCHRDPRKHVRLWHDGDRLVGYALLGDDAYSDWRVRWTNREGVSSAERGPALKIAQWGCAGRRSSDRGLRCAVEDGASSSGSGCRELPRVVGLPRCAVGLCAVPLEARRREVVG